MIRQIATAAVYVSDQKAAEEFWTQKIGFEVKARNSMANGLSWLEVGPKGAQTHVVLYPKALMKDWSERRPSLVFLCDDVEETYRTLKAKGVEVRDPPRQMGWGRFTAFRDPEGNEFILKG